MENPLILVIFDLFNFSSFFIEQQLSIFFGKHKKKRIYFYT